MFKYTLDNKRYHTLNYFYKNKFGIKVFKVSLNGGFSCPNLDGTLGYGGCIYCSKSGSGEFGGDIHKSLTEQFMEIKEVVNKRHIPCKYIGYFQARTNTYAPVDVLRKKYEEVLKIDDVIGLNIATRCDAISDECLNYLEELNKRTFLTIELGLQTIHKKTTEIINRCHTLDEFDEMVKKLRERNINVLVHIINGLPFESEEMMLDTVRHLNKLDIQGIKIHMLHIIKDTEMARLYEKTKFHILSKEEYIDIVIKQLELLNPKIVINRITSDPDKDLLVEPRWLCDKCQLLNDIDKEMKKRNTYQGIKQ
ncbi:MAG: TIGR01212 family radical SAM protein [Erysipelotrichaceae bacterium]|nr:TIGR01212 family radical SAM protein [Erysipelotrichaceae bacterium]MDD6093839.1 TIGR01212 family radical SAM protein [bacterium]MDY3934269.1 TIGR01212 family radical SAM protein [Bacilli bacterium]